MPLTRDLTKFTTASPILATFNYTDIANGLGYIDFYGFAIVDSTGNSYHLGTTTLYSGQIDSQHATGTAITFNSSGFNVARTAKGTAYLNISITFSADNATHTYTLSKVSGATVTALDTAITAINNTKTAADRNVTMEFAISETQFAVGDYIRLLVTRTGSGATWDMGHDPVNRVGTYFSDPSLTPTKMTLSMPFKIDQ